MTPSLDPDLLAVLLSPSLLLAGAFLAAAIELVFPPFWGDLGVLAVFFLAARGHASFPGAFAAALGGSLAGTLAAYLLGRRCGRRAIGWFRSTASRRRPLALLRHFGPSFIVLNRFLPVLRGVLLYAAGALRLDLGRVLLASGLSSAAWFLVLLAAGGASAATWSEAQRGLESGAGVGAAVAFALLLLAVALVVWHRQALRRRAA